MNIVSVIINTNQLLNVEVQRVASFLQHFDEKQDNMKMVIFTTSSKLPVPLYTASAVKAENVWNEAGWDDEIILDYLTNRFVEEPPEVFLFGSGEREKLIAGRLACRLGRKCFSNIKTITREENEYILTRDVYLGNLQQVIRHSANEAFVLQISKNSTGSFEKISELSYENIYQEAALPDFILSCEREQKESVSGWESADTIIVIGNGVEKKDFPMIERLAEKLNGVIAGTRKAVENGILPADRMIGISGKSIAPKCCLILAASGLAAFTKGIEKSKMILSVNEDKDALIFHYSDYGIVQKYQDFVSMILQEETGK